MIVSGSMAMLSYPTLDFKYYRQPTDCDYLISEEVYNQIIPTFGNYKFHSENKWGYSYISLDKTFSPMEFEIIDRNESSKLIYEYATNLGKDRITPELYLMMKLSHRYLKNSPHFLKTMRDIQFLRSKGITLNDELTRILKIREKETYTYAHPKLARSKVDFFENNQEGYTKQDYLVWDHDSIHEAVKLLDKPAYDFIKISSADVLCSKDQFMKQLEHVKLFTVYEETAVLALERILIPGDFKASPKKAFLTALEKVCTSISSGWWREYAWEHYDAVIHFWRTIGVAKYINDYNKAKAAGNLKLWEVNSYVH